MHAYVIGIISLNTYIMLFNHPSSHPRPRHHLAWFTTALTCLALLLLPLLLTAQSDGITRGASDMPYVRYEADAGTYGGGAELRTAPDFTESNTAIEASDQRYVALADNGAFVEWPVADAARGITLRFTLPDAPQGEGVEGSLDLLVNGSRVRTIDLTSYWAWQYYPNSDPNDAPSTRPRMRFDEVHFLLDNALSPGDVVRLVKTNGDAYEYGVDFVEVEPVPPPKPRPTGYVSVTDFGATPDDGTDDLEAFQEALLAAGRAGTGVYIPEGVWTLDNKLLFETSNIGFKGAGIWYTELFFSREEIFTGGILARCTNVELSDFYMNTANNQRFLNGAYVIYKAFMGTYGDDSEIHDTWATHFECGAWIAGYDPPYPIDVTQRLKYHHNRARNNYADGINLCQGTSNSAVYQNNFRSNADDALAVWPNDALGAPEGVNNIFSYNTVESTHRAGGAALFGGDGHEIHHCIFQDGVGSSGIRLTTDFSGFQFEDTENIRIYENTIVSCGTSTDLFGAERGAIELYGPRNVIKGISFENIDIVNAQRHAIQIGGSAEYDLQFSNITIDGAGANPQTRSVFTSPTESAAIMVHARNGRAEFTNLTYENIPREDPIYQDQAFESFELIINDGQVAVTGVGLSTEEVNLITGGSARLTPVFSPTNASNKQVTWSSSNESVAVYDVATQSVRATGTGTATIEVTTEDGGFTAEATVNVEAAVVIAATAPTAREGGAAGAFTVSIPELASQISVNYSVTGTASAADYDASPVLSGSIVLSPGTLSREITIAPVDDDAFEGTESVTLTLEEGDGYQLGGATSATVAIQDNENPPCTAPSIAFVDEGPTIDDRIDGVWGSARVSDIANLTFGGGTPGFGGQWRALATSEALYVLVQVTDADLNNDSGAEWYQDDAVELFIDGDNSKGSSYDGANDFQFGFRWNDAQVRLGGASVQSAAGVNHEMYATSDGYALEVEIPWSTIGTSPSLGDRIGFDVAVDNDNGGGSREAQYTSLATRAGGFSDPSLFGSVFLTTCDDQGDPDPDPDTPVTGVTLSPGAFTLAIGDTRTLTATVSPGDADDASVRWASDNPNVAGVDARGTVTARASGQATITVTTADGGFTATSRVTVPTVQPDPRPVTGVSVSPTTVSLEIGASQVLTAIVNPSDADDPSVTWSTDNAGVATVDASGRVTAVAAGTARVTVTTTDGGFTATSAVTVTEDDTEPEPEPSNTFRIKNVWQQTYLFDAGANVAYTDDATAANTLWAIEEVGDGFVEVRNLATGHYINIENLTGLAQCTPREVVWASSKWAVSDAGSGTVRIRNKWQGGSFLHIENLLGSVQSGFIYNAWASARWILEEVGSDGIAARSGTAGTDVVTNTRSTAVGYELSSAELQIDVYPNPVSDGVLNVILSGAEPGNILTVYSANGQSVMQTVTGVNGARLDLKDVAAGVYILEVQSGDANHRRKFIVR